MLWGMIKKMRRRLGNTLSLLLHQGLSHAQLSKTISIGIVLGLFPVFGASSLLCLGMALRFKYNIIVIQLANLLVAPLQLLLLFPFMKFGQELFGLTGFETAYLDVHGYLHGFVTTHIFAVLGWIILSIPFAVLCYFVALYILKRYPHTHKDTSEQATQY